MSPQESTTTATATHGHLLLPPRLSCRLGKPLDTLHLLQLSLVPLPLFFLVNSRAPESFRRCRRAHTRPTTTRNFPDMSIGLSTIVFFALEEATT